MVSKPEEPKRTGDKTFAIRTTCVSSLHTKSMQTCARTGIRARQRKTGSTSGANPTHFVVEAKFATVPVVQKNFIAADEYTRVVTITIMNENQ